MKKITALIIVVAVIGAGFILNEALKITGAARLENALEGNTYKDIQFYENLKLVDRETDMDYEFYGAMSNFEFSDNNTFKWTRKYNRAIGSLDWTEYVTTNEEYEAVYLGRFIYDSTAFYIKTKNGDILDIEYTRKDGKKVIAGPNYSTLHSENLTAPKELITMDTSTVMKSFDTDKTPAATCGICDGSGKQYKKYRADFLRENNIDPLTPCKNCGGDGILEGDAK